MTSGPALGSEEPTNQQDAPATGLTVGLGAGPALECSPALSTGHRGWAWPGVSIVFKFCFYKEREIYRLWRGRE